MGREMLRMGDTAPGTVTKELRLQLAEAAHTVVTGLATAGANLLVTAPVAA